MRLRPAPMAARIANSRSRSQPRARDRFATFAHAMSNTNPTAAKRINKAGRHFPFKCSGKVTAVMPMP